VAVKDDAGVPVMAPVAEFIDKPDGRDGEIDKVTDGVPPDDVTGIKDVAAIPAVNVSEASAKVVVRAAETVSVKVLELVAPLASVAVTV
jgi:hypothetical protein